MAETTAAGALADTSKLTDFEGLSVRQVGIEIPGAAGGLRDPLRIDPQIVDRELVGEALAEQKRRVDAAQEAAAGIGRIPFDDEAEKAHGDGLHAAGLVPGCPSCDAEVQAAADEAGEAPAEPTPITKARTKTAAKKAAAPKGTT